MIAIKILAVPVSGTLDKKVETSLLGAGFVLKDCRPDLAASLAKHYDPDIVLIAIDRSGFARGLEFLKEMKVL